MSVDSKIKQLDDQFEVLLDNIYFEQIETELVPELRAERRSLADKDDFQFCKTYFPQIFHDDWNELHIRIEKAKRGIFTFSGSRYFGKSAFSYITKLLKPIAQGGLGLIGLGMRTQDDAEQRSAALVRLMLRNKKLCYDYDINVQQDRIGNYIINNKNLVTFGFREGLRNFFDDEFNRFQTIILDDLFNHISVTSEKDNAKVYNFVTAECTGQMRPDGLLIWLFNYVVDISPGKKYADEHPESHFNLPALNEAGETNWSASSIWTTEELIRKRDSLPFDVWMGDWMNDPVLRGNVFSKDWLNFIAINHQKISACLTAIDPSHGQSPSACDKGMCTFGMNSDGLYDILDLYSRKEDWFFVFDYVDEMRNRFPHWKALLFENDFSQWDFAAPYYTQWSKKNNKHLPIILFDSKDNKTQFYGSDKDSRIMNLVFPFQKGKIRINRDIIGTNDYKIWWKSYIGFNVQKPADVLDATATAFIMIGRYINIGTFKSIAKRTYKPKLFGIFK